MATNMHNYNQHNMIDPDFTAVKELLPLSDVADRFLMCRIPESMKDLSIVYDVSNFG